MATTSTTEESIALLHQFNDDVFNGRDYDRIRDVQTEDYVQHGPMGMEIEGRDESIETTKLFHEAFSDLEGTIEFAFGDDEFVCAYYTYRGTHDGDLMGLPATGERAEIHGVTVNRIEDGMIAESWVLADFATLLQQVGVLPSFDQMAA